MTEIGDLIRGEVRAELFGAFPAGVLNAAAAEGIELWNVEGTDVYTLRLRFHEGSLPRMRELAEHGSCELRILRRMGGRSGMRKLIRRRALLAGLLTAALGLLVSSLFIWDIEVRGCRTLTRGQVLRAAEDSGLTIGSFWPGIDTELLRSGMMQRLPELGWMAVNVSGSRAVVVVIERTEKPPMAEEGTAVDLVASRGGLIRRMNVLSGCPMVSEGQLVTEGELLIGGDLESLTGERRRVQARGAVMADTWYEISAVRPRQETMKKPHGLSRSRFALVVGKKRLNLYITGGKAIDECDKIIKEYQFGVKGLFSLPLTVVWERFRPYRTEPGSDYDAAVTARRLYALLESKAEGQILSHSFSPDGNGELQVLTLRAHCTENIARPRIPADVD